MCVCMRLCWLSHLLSLILSSLLLIDAFHAWSNLIEEAVKNMISDLKVFKQHDYVVKDGKIGYKEQDGISFNIRYGYQTLFAYFYENELGNVTNEELQNQIRMGVECGRFSYAEVPHTFQSILGVTGTLQALSVPQKDLVENIYNIKKQSIIPSVYGVNQLEFSKDSLRDVQIESMDSFYISIRNEINARLVGSAGADRAVLVFFESTAKLNEFFNAAVMLDMKGRVNIMTEEMSTAEKPIVVRRAATSGSITLCSRVFGRGTDFICEDQRVLSSGGVHVIQTFLSEELAEEIQIRGRTGRQGNKGSYSMVLLSDDLEKYGILQPNIETMKASGIRYDVLHKNRNDLFEKLYPESVKYVTAIGEGHKSSMDFIDKLLMKDAHAVHKYLTGWNIGSNGSSDCRTICLMDATCSMHELLTKAKQTVGTMFHRATQILSDGGVSGLFEMQFAVFRNYNSRPESILQFSPWESQPHKLEAFMNTISVDGGWGNEAVEIGLWHVNEELKLGDVSQVILIGDAPANTVQEVSEKRGRYNFNGTKFGNATHFEHELMQEIGKYGIPVHTYHVNDRAAANFKVIADMTGGQSQFLDVNSLNGATLLTNMVTEQIIRNAAGSKGDSLVAAYRKQYC